MQIAGLSNIKAIAQGGAQFALDNDGNVWSWGNNDGAMLGQNIATDTAAHATPAQVFAASGTNPGDVGNVGGKLGNVIAISGGMALLSDGGTPAITTVVTWGDNEFGQAGDGHAFTSNSMNKVPVKAIGLPASTTNTISAIAAGGTGDTALDGSGNVWAWGAAPGNAANDDSSTPAKVSGITGATSVGAGAFTGFAVVP